MGWGLMLLQSRPERIPSEEDEVTVKTSIQIESFELTMCDIRDVAPEHLHGLSVAVRWPHRIEDWEFLLTEGQGMAAIDPIGRVMGSAMWFPMGDDFATVGMVITSPRLQTLGTGRWLMDHALGALPQRRLGLNSTRAARRLYRSIGFAAEAPVYQCQGEARLPPHQDKPPAGGILRDVTAADLPEIIALDAVAFRASRSNWLKRLLAVSQGFVLERQGKITAFALARRFGRGHVIGPVVARTDEDAIAVTRPHVAHRQGRFLRLDTRHGSGAFADFLQQSGLALFDTVTTMSLRAPWALGLSVPSGESNEDHQTAALAADSPLPPITYGLASQALG